MEYRFPRDTLILCLFFDRVIEINCFVELTAVIIDNRKHNVKLERDSLARITMKGHDETRFFVLHPSTPTTTQKRHQSRGSCSRFFRTDNFFARESSRTIDA
jgi:hypothetical protein